MVSPGPPPAGGGIGAYTEKTSRTLAALGHEVHVLIPGTSQLTTEIVDGVRMHRVPTGRIRPRALARSLAVSRALRSLGHLDIVQACEWEGEAWWYSLRPGASLVTRLATPHFVVEDHEQLTRRQRWHTFVRRWLERSQTRRSAQVISPSTTLAGEVARRWRLRPESITIVPTGIRHPRAAAGSLPEDLHDMEYVLYFGRLERRKGVDTWIDALPEVLASRPSLHAVFVGEDTGLGGRSFVDIARERCGEYWSRLHFLPELPQARLFPIVAAARMVVMPSRSESLANACLEAMALGRPVVATKGTGLAELITDGIDGFLVRPGDVAALASTVRTAVSDDALLSRVRHSARRRAGDFDLDRMVDKLVQVYEDVLDRRTLTPSVTST
jgi:glycosyltransferase involved in cell wall biosynthesis